MIDLKNIANDCEFGLIKSDLIRDRIVCGTNSEKVKLVGSLILNVPVNNCSVMLGRSRCFLGITVTFGE